MAPDRLRLATREHEGPQSGEPALWSGPEVLPGCPRRIRGSVGSLCASAGGSGCHASRHERALGDPPLPTRVLRPLRKRRAPDGLAHGVLSLPGSKDIVGALVHWRCACRFRRLTRGRIWGRVRHNALNIARSKQGQSRPNRRNNT